MKKEENRKTACEAKQEENFSLCGNSGNQSLSAENAGEEKSNACRCGDGDFLFYSALFSHGESCLEHRFRDDEFSCRLLHVPPKPALCAGICGERRGADCAVVAGDGGKSRVFIRGSLLFRVSRERYIRILQLEKNAGGAIAGSRA